MAKLIMHKIAHWLGWYVTYTEYGSGRGHGYAVTRCGKCKEFIDESWVDRLLEWLEKHSK